MSGPMTFVQAVTLAAEDPDLWLRQAGGCDAFCVARGRLVRVPTLAGGELAMCPTVQEILGLWEVVSPEVALRDLHRG